MGAKISHSLSNIPPAKLSRSKFIPIAVLSSKLLIDATIESIESKVIHRAAWIAKQQRQFAKYAPPLPAPECVSGEGYRYLGRQYRLKLIESSIYKIRLWQGQIRSEYANALSIENM